LAGEPVKFYTDVHIDRAVVEKLRELGVDIVRAEDLGLHDAADIEHLHEAHRQGRVVVTKDADFQALHRRGEEPSGIAYFRQAARIGYRLSQLHLMSLVCSAEDMRGKLE
jgi:predicted nuclease of predicted toxin-antitoxin system